MTRREGGRLLIEGPAVIDTVPALLAEGSAAIADGDVIVDFAAATPVDSSALALMLQWRREAEARGKPLAFEHVPDNLRVLAELYSVSFLLDAGSVPEA